MYNEVQRIGSSLKTIAASNLAAPNCEIILVDDGSQDGSADLAEKIAANLGLVHLRVLRLAINRGKGAATKAGMLAATGLYRAFADADLSVGVDDIEECFRRLETGEADVVYASRAHVDSEIGNSQPGFRVLSGRTFNFILRRLALTDELDTQCGLKGFSAEAADLLFSTLTTHGFAFDVELLALAGRANLRVKAMPIHWSHVEASRVRAIRDGANMFRDVLALRRALGAKPAEPVASAGQMGIEKFEIMERLEDQHWWFRAKRVLVSEQIRRFYHGQGHGLDVGCGTGGVLKVLEQQLTSVTGAEYDPFAAVVANNRTRVTTAIVQSRAEALPFSDGSYQVLTSLDVIEHLDDDIEALTEYRRVLANEGVLIIAVPAYQWAWSRHDEALGHRRRYTQKSLRKAVEAAGFEVRRVTYFHSWLAPIAAVLRLTPLRFVLRGNEEEVSYVNPAINKLLYFVASIERQLMRYTNLPFGLSVLLIASKPTEQQ